MPCYDRPMNDVLDLTTETLIDLDEPEALLSTLAKAARRKADALNKRKHSRDERLALRWTVLADALADAELTVDAQLNAKPAGPDFRPDAEEQA